LIFNGKLRQCADAGRGLVGARHGPGFSKPAASPPRTPDGGRISKESGPTTPTPLERPLICGHTGSDEQAAAAYEKQWSRAQSRSADSDPEVTWPRYNELFFDQGAARPDRRNHSQLDYRRSTRWENSSVDSRGAERVDAAREHARYTRPTARRTVTYRALRVGRRRAAMLPGRTTTRIRFIKRRDTSPSSEMIHETASFL